MPTGIVTFLFTDLEGSTRLWREHPEAMRAALARHDELMADAVVAAGGRVVKYTGDGCYAVFEEATGAVDAAVAAQLALGSEPWPLPDPLRARMGIHSGPAELRDGDYHGTSANRAARLMSAAHSGQIVVSHATEQLVAEADVELLDLGEHVLRDLGRPERIFQVLHPELDREFPALGSLSSFAGNLPVQVTSFVGRSADVERVVGLLGEARLVTLAGTGGVGKTRLAVQVAAEVLPRFAAGAWMCELASADDADAMAHVVAAAVGCVQHPGRSLPASIVEFLKVREALVLLDNCEHLLDDAGDLVGAILRGCPEVTVLATSREALDVPGEHVVRVRSLATPDGDGDDIDGGGDGAAELLGAASVRLFRDRAEDAGADVRWDSRQWVAVGEICRRVDGIPLAIELAAARAVSMSPVDVAGHLDERFRLLTGRRRGRIERHRTLRATVEWSYQLLELDERLVFDRLGIFAGSFDGAAAVAVAGDDELDKWAVTDALASLVSKSMVGTETGPDGATRYTMLETLRQYARERLEEEGHVDRHRRALAVYLGDLARDASRGVLGPNDAVWLERVRADIDDLRAAVGWAIDAAEPADQELGLAILAPLSFISQNCGDLGLGAYASKALPLVERAPSDLGLPVLVLAAHFWWSRGDLDRARRLIERTLEHDVTEPAETPLDAYTMSVAIEMSGGDHTRAFEVIESLRGLSDRYRDDPDLARMLGGFAAFEAMAGRPDAARSDSETAMRIAQRTGNANLLANALNGRAWAVQGDEPEEALALAERFLDLYRRHGVARNVAPGVASLAAGLRARLGDDVGALAVLGEALALARDDGGMPQAAAALGFALTPLRRTGRPEVAATILGALDDGAIGQVASFPGTREARARARARLEGILGDERVTELAAHGAQMTYDEIVRYALDQLPAPAEPTLARGAEGSAVAAEQGQQPRLG